MFTFLTISYNQEKFIIEHLESIKYQVQNHGKNEEFKYILSDDCSTDSTVNIVEKWIQANSELFKEVRILTNDKNKGIVSNYLRGTAEVDTVNFKSLAGDDLFYHNNIFEVIGNNNLIFTPIIKFDKNGINGCWPINYLIMNKKADWLRKLIELDNYYFNAPGAFISTKLIQDTELRSFISKFKWREDVPKWYYLLKYRNEISINVEKNPYVLYRISEGISLNRKHSKYSEFVSERTEVEKQMNFKKNKYPKYINPYNYYCKFLNLRLHYYDNRFNKEVIEANEIMKDEISKAPEYLNYIRTKAYEFYKAIGREELYDKPIIVNKN